MTVLLSDLLNLLLDLKFSQHLKAFKDLVVLQYRKMLDGLRCKVLRIALIGIL